MQRRQEILDDITDTVGATFLGMTYGCARCHDHKFDPILQTDYYRCRHSYANTAADDQIPLLSKEADREARKPRRRSGKKRPRPSASRCQALLEPAKHKI